MMSEDGDLFYTIVVLVLLILLSGIVIWSLS